MSKKTEIKSFDQQLTDWRKQFNKEIPERLELLFNTNVKSEVIIEEYMTDENPTTRKIRVVRSEGKRQVNRETQFYNLDMVISVGYRVNSIKATQFRKFAARVLHEYIQKGFVLNDDRFKQGRKFDDDAAKENMGLTSWAHSPQLTIYH